jgi:hypothetical protein
MVSEQELEQLIAKRLKERQEIINEAVGALRPELDRMSREIASANHIKQTLGKQVLELTREVRKTNLELTNHAALKAHPGTAADIAEIREELAEGEGIMQEFGIKDLSAEQRKAFPSVLKGFVVKREEERKEQQTELRRQAWIHVGSSFISALLGAATTAAAVIGWIATHPSVGP